MAKAKAAGAARAATSQAKKSPARKTDVFAAAAKPAKDAKKAPSAVAGTTLKIPDVAGEDVHAALRFFRSAKLQKKSAEAQQKAADEELSPIVLGLFCQAWIAAGGLPQKPYTVVNNKGEELALVLQDKSNAAAIREDLLDAVAAELPGIRDLVDPETSFTFDTAVLAEPGVREKLNEAIVAAGLTKEQQNNLLVSKTVYRTRESLVPQLLTLANGDPRRLATALELLQGLITRYLNS